MSRSSMNPSGATPHRPSSAATSLVLFDGRIMVCLGRTGSGAWKLLPLAAFGTAAARGAVVTTRIPPMSARLTTRPVDRREGDRRGRWMRPR